MWVYTKRHTTYFGILESLKKSNLLPSLALPSVFTTYAFILEGPTENGTSFLERNFTEMLSYSVKSESFKRKVVLMGALHTIPYKVIKF